MTLFWYFVSFILAKYISYSHCIPNQITFTESKCDVFPMFTLVGVTHVLFAGLGSVCWVSWTGNGPLRKSIWIVSNTKSTTSKEPLLMTLYRAYAMFAPNQWKTVLLCNDVSHGLGGSLESALLYHQKILWRSLDIIRFFYLRYHKCYRSTHGSELKSDTWEFKL